MNKVIIDYGRLPDGDLFSFSKSVYESILDNPYFPTPSPSMPNFLADVNGYGTAHANTYDRSTKAIALKNAARQVVLNDLRDIAMYVNTTSRGNEVMLTSSGLVLVKARVPRHVIAPQIKKLMQGPNPGEVTVKLVSQKGCSYLFEASKDPINENSQWLSEGSKQATYTFTGLEEGVMYWFRATAIGPRGQKVIGDAMPFYVSPRSMGKAA